MLRELGASDPRFKTLTFHSGLNLLVADLTPGSADTDSRNGAGKSSVVELLHFLLGGSGDRGGLFAREPLRETRFHLKLGWPGQPAGLRVTRSGNQMSWVQVEPLPEAVDPAEADLGTGLLKNTEWRRLIARDLFGLGRDQAEISSRTMLSFLIRRASSHAYNEPTRSFPRQSEAEAGTNLAYLLGLDWRLADRYRALKEREAAQRQMRKAAEDPILGRIIGKMADLRGEITLAEQRVSDMKRQIADFRVVPEYEHLRQTADELNQRIRDLRNRDVVDQRNLQDLRRSVEESAEPDISYVEPVYRELGVILSDQVRRRFEEVREFHHSVVRNRQRYLRQEIDTIRQRLADSEAERQRLGEQQAELMRTLREGGALDTLTTLQQALAQQQAMLSMLRHRYEAARAVETTKREISQQRLALQDEMTIDLDERRAVVGEATILFSKFAQRLYGSGRPAYLRFDASPSSLRIDPHIDTDASAGIGSMVIFCFDLTVAVIAHRAGRCPDFLVHDSNLFDGVDERQLAAALNVAAETSREEGLQYVVTINSDDLAKAERRGFDPTPHLLPQRLTDSDDGGLFGYRF